MEMDSLKYGIFSFIIPGLGQYLNGDKKKGVAFLLAAAGLHIFMWFFLNNAAGSAFQTLYHLYAGYDAYKNY